MKIRQEKRSDYDEVYALVKASFATTSDSDDSEADYLNDVRKKDTFIPQLSLVAEDKDGKIIGQIVLYKTAIDTPTGKLFELLLSPISVHPEYFRQGIARTLMQEAFGIAKNLGYKAVFLCGDPTFYRKVGFKPTYEYEIFHVNDKNAEWSMVTELNEGSLHNIKGTINTI